MFVTKDLLSRLTGKIEQVQTRRRLRSATV